METTVPFGNFLFDNCHSPFSPTTFFEIGVYTGLYFAAQVMNYYYYFIHGLIFSYKFNTYFSSFIPYWDPNEANSHTPKVET